MDIMKDIRMQGFINNPNVYGRCMNTACSHSVCGLFSHREFDFHCCVCSGTVAKRVIIYLNKKPIFETLGT